MGVLDIILAIPILWFAYKGFSKGLIIELATLLALLLGIYVAIKFSDLTESYLINNLDFHGKYTHIIAFSLTFIGVVLLVNLVGRLVSKIADMVMLGWLNKLAGVVFGVLKAAFILSILIYIVNRLDVKEHLITPELKQESKLYKPIEGLSLKVFPYLEEGGTAIRDAIP